MGFTVYVPDENSCVSLNFYLCAYVFRLYMSHFKTITEKTKVNNNGAFGHQACGVETVN